MSVTGWEESESLENRKSDNNKMFRCSGSPAAPGLTPTAERIAAQQCVISAIDRQHHKEV